MENVEKWLETWLLLYPDIEFGGYKLRSKPKECIAKMQKFVKLHPEYTKDIIFGATNLYLKERAKEDYNYTKQAQYFISKLGQQSLLENYCAKYVAWNAKPQIEKVLETIQEWSPIDDFI